MTSDKETLKPCDEIWVNPIGYCDVRFGEREGFVKYIHADLVPDHIVDANKLVPEQRAGDCNRCDVNRFRASSAEKNYKELRAGIEKVSEPKNTKSSPASVTDHDVREAVEYIQAIINPNPEHEASSIKIGWLDVEPIMTLIRAATTPKTCHCEHYKKESIHRGEKMSHFSKQCDKMVEALDLMPFVMLTVQSNGALKVGTIEYGENERYYSQTSINEALAEYRASQGIK